MRLVFTLLLLSNALTIAAHMDWCEYWARMGKQHSRPECAGYQLPEVIMQLSPIRRNPPDAKRCEITEKYGCLDCEKTCGQAATKCKKRECLKKGCACHPDRARDNLGNCILLSECPEEFSILSSVRRMMPVLFKDMWKAVLSGMKIKSGSAGAVNNTDSV